MTLLARAGAGLLSGGQLDLALTVWSRSGETRIDIAWFGIHTYDGPPHKLVAINDYGLVDGQCAQNTFCAGCGTSHRCSLAEGHPPPCSLLRDDDSGIVIPSRPTPMIWGIK
jgi:hypothetical protein